jgi:hypothetical protein
MVKAGHGGQCLLGGSDVTGSLRPGGRGRLVSLGFEPEKGSLSRGLADAGSAAILPHRTTRRYFAGASGHLGGRITWLDMAP